ncbi:hypothetical protein BTR14_02130 [Rhizobium rhizosphaerae]|uniref:TadE-like domain-containing protein n=1 Tax=Xaviernesmea rhizosphaerae TaxID=1672749 RepID=A0ABX3PIB1_9HYPH|nr:TadE/TadG family type IV pilus assembly protein [Xaviernesmea rhizosphaerae]OQP88265.1 hypothetical protein BTR14_02130 [Xaviernesmea rhizosphaerae]
MRIAKLARARQGATAVEFAILIGPMMLLLFGGIEVSRVMWINHALEKVALTSARCIGIRNNACSNAGAYDASRANSYVITAAAGLGITLVASNIVIEDGATCYGATGFSKVTLTKTVTSPIPKLIDLLSNSAHQLTAQACFPTAAS